VAAKERRGGQDGAVVLFDGVCNLCNGFVQFVIERDPDAYFSFASLQSEAAARLLSAHGYEGATLDSVVLLENGRLYSRSDAALRVARHLGRGWPLLGGFRVVPRFVRDRVYDWIAANRYQWFGRRDECMIPTPELRARFLE
jgi:predicted DCC family thiol-disulfide oxidoreductase YuxK